MQSSLFRNVSMLAGAMGVFAALQPVLSQPASAQVTVQSRVCTARGQPANAGVAEPWAITVSNEGNWCSHSRIPATRQTNITFEVVKPPQHGEITQQAQGPKTIVSYKPVKGYVGSDNFTLRLGARNMEYPYLISVIP